MMIIQLAGEVRNHNPILHSAALVSEAVANRSTHVLTESRSLLRLALPLVGAQLAQMGMGVMDTVMAGRYGSVDLAGVALGGSVLWPTMMLFMGLVQAVTPTVSQLNGARRHAEVPGGHRGV